MTHCQRDHDQITLQHTETTGAALRRDALVVSLLRGGGSMQPRSRPQALTGTNA